MKNVWHGVCWVLSAVAVGVSLYLFAHRGDLFPAMVPTHWNLAGKPDIWTPRENLFWHLLGMPLFMCGFTLLSYLFPWLSPRHFKVDANRKVYGYIIFLVVTLFGYLHTVIVLTFAEPEGGDFLRFFLGGVFFFFMLFGNVMGQVPRNFWMGVRTPWTLASNLVWVKTHRLAAWLCVAGGLAGLVLVWLDASPYLYIATLVLALGIPVVYSLVLYKQLEKNGQLALEQSQA